MDVQAEARGSGGVRQAARRAGLPEGRRGLKPGTRMPDTPAREPSRATLAELEDHGAFRRRHIGPDETEQADMLQLLGYPSRAALIDAVVPPSIRLKQP